MEKVLKMTLLIISLLNYEPGVKIDKLYAVFMSHQWHTNSIRIAMARHTLYKK